MFALRRVATFALLVVSVHGLAKSSSTSAQSLDVEEVHSCKQNPSVLNDVGPVIANKGKQSDLYHYWAGRDKSPAEACWRREGEELPEDAVVKADERCLAATGDKDFLHFSGTTGASVLAAGGHELGYSDPFMHTAPGVHLQYAQFCVHNGWLDFKPEETERLLGSFKEVQKLAADECAHVEPPLASNTTSRSLSAENNAKLVALHSKIDQNALDDEFTAKSIRKGLMSLEDAHLEKRFKCMLGELGCQIHLCLYAFCKLADGRVGMGSQCSNDFSLLEPADDALWRLEGKVENQPPQPPKPTKKPKNTVQEPEVEATTEIEKSHAPHEAPMWLIAGASFFVALAGHI